MSEMIIISWVICGILAYGITFADFHYSYPLIAEERRWYYIKFSILFGLLGPFGLFASFLGSKFAKHGLKFK